MLDNTSFRQVDIKIQGHVCGKRGTETYVSLVVAACLPITFSGIVSELFSELRYLVRPTI